MTLGSSLGTSWSLQTLISCLFFTCGKLINEETPSAFTTLNSTPIKDHKLGVELRVERASLKDKMYSWWTSSQSLGYFYYSYLMSWSYQRCQRKTDLFITSKGHIITVTKYLGRGLLRDQRLFLVCQEVPLGHSQLSSPLTGWRY